MRIIERDKINLSNWIRTKDAYPENLAMIRGLYYSELSTEFYIGLLRYSKSYIPNHMGKWTTIVDFIHDVSVDNIAPVYWQLASSSQM